MATKAIHINPVSMITDFKFPVWTKIDFDVRIFEYTDRGSKVIYACNYQLVSPYEQTEIQNHIHCMLTNKEKSQIKRMLMNAYNAILKNTIIEECE